MCENSIGSSSDKVLVVVALTVLLGSNMYTPFSLGTNTPRRRSTGQYDSTIKLVELIHLVGSAKDFREYNFVFPAGRTQSTQGGGRSHLREETILSVSRVACS